MENLLAEAAPPDYVAVQAFIDPAREDELEPLVERARATGCVVTVGLGPRYLHSTGQLHKGGPPTGRFVQVVDDPGEELPIPGREFGFRRLIHCQAWVTSPLCANAGGLSSASDWRTCEARNRRPRPHGRQHDGAPPQRAATRWRRTRAPRRSAPPTPSSSSPPRLEQPRVVWLMIPAGEPTEMVFQTLLPLLEDGDILVDGGNSQLSGLDAPRRGGEGEGCAVRRCGRLGRDLGPARGLLHHGRRRKTPRTRPWSPSSRRSLRRTATRTSARPAPATS